MILHEACQYEVAEVVAEKDLFMVENSLSMGLTLSRDFGAKVNFAHESVLAL